MSKLKELESRLDSLQKTQSLTNKAIKDVETEIAKCKAEENEKRNKPLLEKYKKLIGKTIVIANDVDSCNVLRCKDVKYAESSWSHSHLEFIADGRVFSFNCKYPKATLLDYGSITVNVLGKINISELDKWGFYNKRLTLLYLNRAKNFIKLLESSGMKLSEEMKKIEKYEKENSLKKKEDDDNIYVC